MCSSYRIVIAVAILAPLVAPAQAAPVQWTAALGGNDHFYDALKAGPGGTTWANASTAANAAGGYLATITSEAENQFVFGLVSSDSTFFDGYGPWLGGYQLSGSVGRCPSDS